jgi:O-methyltransferase
MLLRGRRQAKRAVNRLLAPVGARVITRHEEQGIRHRYRSTVEQLYRTQAAQFSPPLRPRAGRLDLLCQLIGTEPAEALHLLYWLQQAQAGLGDVCEFGVAQGATSALLANEIRDSTRTLWLYDSFAGLPVPHAKDVLLHDIFGLGTMSRYAGTMACRPAEVRERLAAIGFPPERTRVVEGVVRPDLPDSVLPRLVAFAYLDFDLYEPIRTALDLVHPRCRPGSVLMVDDYGYFSSGPRTAVQEFLARHPEAYRLEVPEVGSFCVLRRA